MTGTRTARLGLLVVATMVWAEAGCAVTRPGGEGGTVDAVPGEHSGTLPNGTTWIAEVPEDWNGTLLLYGHGFVPPSVPGPPKAQLAPDTATQDALLARGYALAGSSYSRNGWALGTAAQDQLDTLDSVVDTIGAAPQTVLAYGSSMGGLVTGQLAETAGDVIDGALPTCGLMHGGIGLGNYQLDGAHAINQLLDPEADIELVGYRDVADAMSAADALVAAIEAGQDTPQGRARVALAAALFHLPHQLDGQAPPAEGDWEAMQAAQYEWLGQTIGFVIPGRFDIESQAGGNGSWNVGVDYRRLLKHSADREQVEALYASADLDLRADLNRLTSTADVETDPAALDWLKETSVLSGDLAMPVLSLHTTSDALAPVQVEEAYKTRVRRAGGRPMLRQAVVDRVGHCSFTPAELVASIEALESTVESGHWSHFDPARLDQQAESLDLGESDIVRFDVGRFLGQRHQRHHHRHDHRHRRR